MLILMFNLVCEAFKPVDQLETSCCLELDFPAGMGTVLSFSLSLALGLSLTFILSEHQSSRLSVTLSLMDLRFLMFVWSVSSYNPLNPLFAFRD